LGKTFLRRVNGHFCGRKREDEPSVARVHMGESQYLPEKGARSPLDRRC
jgi:hypothetical protein